MSAHHSDVVFSTIVKTVWWRTHLLWDGFRHIAHSPIDIWKQHKLVRIKRLSMYTITATRNIDTLGSFIWSESLFMDIWLQYSYWNDGLCRLKIPGKIKKWKDNYWFEAASKQENIKLRKLINIELRIKDSTLGSTCSLSEE